MLSRIIFFASDSIVMAESSAVNDVTTFGGREPTLARGWMEYFARMRAEVLGPRL